MTLHSTDCCLLACFSRITFFLCSQNTNTIGNIPIEWYDDLPHIGYSVDGKRIMRPAKGDELDKFLATVEDPDSW
jgi:hypothetical protein